MRTLVFFIAVVFLAGISMANAETAKEAFENWNVASPTDIAEARRTDMSQIEYMADNYSLSELALYAVRLNKSQIETAKRSGVTPPAKLTRDILQDRDKIVDYLRHQYDFKY